MPYNPIKIANEFIRLAQHDNPPQGLSPLKLIKLVYLAHGWSFPILGRPLCEEQAQAWQYGPVIPTLYFSIRHYRADPINGLIDGDNDPQGLDEDALELIAQVYARYGDLSATRLSALTHMPNTPWSITWARNERNATIPNELIANHYNQLMEQAAA